MYFVVLKTQKYLVSSIKGKEKLYVCWMITEAGREGGKYVFEVGRSECPSMPQVASATALTPTRLLYAVRLFLFQRLRLIYEKIVKRAIIRGI